MADPIKRAGIILGIVLAVVAAFLAVSMVAPSAAHAQSGTPHWILELKDGIVDIELLPAKAPKHVERIVELTNEGFYNGIVFHRVIEGFMAQSGDPTGTGTGGSDKPDVVAEFNDTSFGRGAVGAARTNDPNTFNSQFFICFQDCTFLNGQYTVFGQVVSGMEAVDKITRGEPPANPDKIISAKIEYK
ncbi:peptidylprolyl isomerase [Devosia sp. CN2-171]|uniref:peptidylprolyl isomerase n=1 Tax=Devosia sp. CN2-171 TaxID=3400909 RepID=UPI003BF8844D